MTAVEDAERYNSTMILRKIQSFVNPLSDVYRSLGTGAVSTVLQTLAGVGEAIPSAFDFTKKLAEFNPTVSTLKLADAISGGKVDKKVDALGTDFKKTVREYEFLKNSRDLISRGHQPQTQAGEIAGNIGGVGTSIGAALFTPTLVASIAGQSGVATRDTYDSAIARGDSEEDAEDAAAKVMAQSLVTYGLTETLTGKMLKGTAGLGKMLYGRAKPMQKVLRVLDKAPLRIAAVGVGEGITEGLQDVSVSNIQEQALEGEYFSPTETAEGLLSNPATQKEFLTSFIYGLVGGAGAKGILDVATRPVHKLSEPASNELLEAITEKDAIPKVISHLQNAENKQGILHLSLYNALRDKNPTVPDAVLINSVDFSSIATAITSGKDSISDKNWGEILLPNISDITVNIAKLENLNSVFEEVQAEAESERAFQAEFDNITAEQPLAFEVLTPAGVILRKAKAGEMSVRRGDVAKPIDLPDGTVVARKDAVRIALRESRKDTKRVEGIVEELSKNIPLLKATKNSDLIKFVKQDLIDGVARGKFSQKGIELAQTGNVSTVVHESWHMYFNTAMSTEEKNLFNREIHRKHKKLLDEQMEIYDSMKIAEQEAGAILAEKFVREKRTPKTFLERMVDRLRNAVQNILGTKSAILEQYQQFYVDPVDARQKEKQFFREQQTQQNKFYKNGMRTPLLHGTKDADSISLYQRLKEDDFTLVKTGLSSVPNMCKGSCDVRKMAVSKSASVRIGGDEKEYLGNFDAYTYNRRFFSLDFSGYQNDVQLDVLLTMAARNANAEGKTVMYVPTADTATKYYEKSDTRYLEGGSVYKAYRRVFGKLGKPIEIEGYTWYRVKTLDLHSDVFERAKDIQMFSGWLKKNNIEVTPKNLSREVRKYFLKSKTTNPVTFGDERYYPVYVSVGNDLLGDDKEGVVAGFVALKKNQDMITDLTMDVYDSKSSSGDIAFKKWDSAVAEKIMDEITRVMKSSGMQTVRFSKDLPAPVKSMIEKYYNQPLLKVDGFTMDSKGNQTQIFGEADIDITKKPIFDTSPVKFNEVLYQRAARASDAMLAADGITDKWLVEQGLVGRSALKKAVLFGKEIAGGVADFGTKVVRTQSSRIASIDPRTSGEINQMYFDADQILKEFVDDQDLFSRIEKAYRELSKKERKGLDLYLVKQDKESIKKASTLIPKDDLDALLSIFDRTHEALTKSGFKVNKLDFYLPRKIKKDGKKLPKEDIMQRFYRPMESVGKGTSGHRKQRTRSAEDITAENIGEYEPVLPYAINHIQALSRFIAQVKFFNTTTETSKNTTVIKPIYKKVTAPVGKKEVETFAEVQIGGNAEKGVVAKLPDGTIDLDVSLKNKWRVQASAMLADTFQITDDGMLVSDDGTLIPPDKYSFKNGQVVDKKGKAIKAKQLKYALDDYNNFLRNKDEWKHLIRRMFAPKSPRFIKAVQAASAIKAPGYSATLAQYRIAAKASFENLARTSADTNILRFAMGFVDFATGGRKVEGESGAEKFVQENAKDWILDREKIEQERGLFTEKFSNKIFGLSGWRYFREKSVEIQQQTLYRDLRALVKRAEAGDTEAQALLSTKYRVDLLPKERRQQAYKDLQEGVQNMDVHRMISQAESRTDITNPAQKPGWAAHNPIGNMMSMMKSDMFKHFDFALTKASDRFKVAKKEYDIKTMRLVDREVALAQKEGREPNLNKLRQKDLNKAKNYVYATYDLARTYMHSVAWYGALFTGGALFKHTFALLNGEDDDFEKQMDRIALEALLRQTGISPYDVWQYQRSGNLADLGEGFTELSALTIPFESVGGLFSGFDEHDVKKIPVLGDVIYHWFLPRNEVSKDQFAEFLKDVDLSDLDLDDLDLDLDIDL